MTQLSLFPWGIAMSVGMALGVVGCGPTLPRTPTTPPLESSQNVVYLDTTAALQIPCETVKAERLATGRTRVLARFFNKRDSAAECQINVKFKDGAGKVIDETGWISVVFPRRESTQFERTSLTPDAKDFTLLLRVAE